MIKFLLRIFIINIFLVSSSYSEIIKDIKINGNKRITEETIKVIGNINKVTDYDDKKLNELTKQLYNSEFFKDISISLTNNILTINLVENPIIEDIQIEGIKRESVKEVLLEKISLRNRKSFTESSLQNDITLIQNILKSTGYYFVKVSPSISTARGIA